MSCPTQQPRDISQAAGSAGVPQPTHPHTLTVLIPANRLWKFEKELKAVNRSLKERGFRMIELRMGDVVDERYTDNTLTIYQEIILNTPAPLLGNWLVVGKVKGGQATNFSADLLPDGVETGGATCDACGGKRSSKILYLLKSQNGEIKRVEASCLTAFTGQENPMPVVRLAETLGSLPERGEKFRQNTGAEPGRGEGRWIPALDFLAYAVAASRNFNYTSRRDAQEAFLPDDLSTAELALQGMIGATLTFGWQPTAEDYQFAREAIQWVRDELSRKIQPFEDDTYRVDLVKLLRADSFDVSRIGLAASLIPTFQRVWERRQQELQAAGNSRYIGTIGERREFDDLTVTEVIPIQKEIRNGWRSMITTTHLHKFADAEGNRLVWFSSSKALPVGAKCRGRATIKSHEEYKGIKQTVLSRCEFSTG